MRGVQKHDKKYRKKNLTLVRFRTLTHPPTTGVTDFFFGGPLTLTLTKAQAHLAHGCAGNLSLRSIYPGAVRSAPLSRRRKSYIGRPYHKDWPLALKIK
jgi:hypothetical protein